MQINNYRSTINFNSKYSDYFDKIDEPDKIKVEKKSECDLDSDDFFNFPDSFREGELWDPNRDSRYSDLPESEEDIPVPFLPNRVVLLDLNPDDMTDPAKYELKPDRVRTEQVPLPTVREEMNHTFDTSERPYVILHKNGKKLYLEEFFGRESASGIYKKITDKLSEGYKLPDVINVYHNAIVKKDFSARLSDSLAEYGFKMLDKKKDIKEVIELMDKNRKSILIKEKISQDEDCVDSPRKTDDPWKDFDYSKSYSIGIFRPKK